MGELSPPPTCSRRWTEVRLCGCCGSKTAHGQEMKRNRAFVGAVAARVAHGQEVKSMPASGWQRLATPRGESSPPPICRRSGRYILGEVPIKASTTPMEAPFMPIRAAQDDHNECLNFCVGSFLHGGAASALHLQQEWLGQGQMPLPRKRKQKEPGEAMSIPGICSTVDDSKRCHALDVAQG